MVHMVALWLWPEHRKDPSPLQPATLGRKYYKKILVNHQQFNSAKEEKNILRNLQFVATTHTHATNSYILYCTSLLF